VTRSVRRAAGAVVVLAVAGLVAGCGGGFSSAPASPPDDVVSSYVALGDDFTSAAGADATPGDDGCARSDKNFPSLAAQDLHIKTLHDVSCPGATTASLTTKTDLAKDKSVPPQLDAVTKGTDLVTLGIGLEDRDLLQHVFQICLAAPCGAKIPPQTILSDVSAMSDSLASAVRAIQDKAPDSYVVLVGYPTITPDAGSCDALPDLEQPSLDAASQVLDEINRELRFTARETGAGYLDVARLSTGHELCSGEPWVEADKGKKGQPTTYHPVAAEQRAVADALVALVKNH
jgi:hypothetical protein